MKMNLRPQQPKGDRQHGDTAVPKSSASESSTKAQYGDAHEHVSRRAGSGSSAQQHRRRRRSSLTAAALEAHSSGEQGGSHRRESRYDTLAQVGARDVVRPRRPRRRSTGTPPPRIRDEAVPEQALQGDGAAAAAAALESKLKMVHFNPFTTEFGDPAGPSHGIILPPAPAKSRGPHVFVERMLDEFGDLQAWYR